MIPDRFDFTRLASKRLNRPIISGLQQELRRAIEEVASASSEYAILDFPNHANIGDSAIYAGEAKLCREYFNSGPLLVTETSEDDIERVAKLDEDVVLFLHGGGNFGDLYDIHQNFRNKVLTLFANHKIVLLPQSIHFENFENVQSTKEVIDRHPDFTMMVRDKFSLDFAKNNFDCKVLLVPDMAFALGPLASTVIPDLKILGLMREDKEAKAIDKDALEQLAAPNEILDWPREEWEKSPLNRLPRNIRAYLPPSMQKLKPVSPRAFEWLANKRVQVGLDILARGEVVLTDRLHAHILSILLGLPHVALDNSYGKIKRYSDLWTRGGGFSKATNLDEACSLLK